MFVSSSRFSRRALVIGALALTTAWSSTADLRAQGDRITLPRKPGPNQTVTVHMSQDMELQMSMLNKEPEPGAASDSDTAPARSMPPMKLNGTMMVEGTQKFGEIDDQGHTPCEFTYTDANMDMKMNGMSVPSGDFKDQFVGKSMTFSYAPDGTVTVVKVADSSPGAANVQATVQQALNAFTMSLPTKPLGIGESERVPLNMPMMMPLPGGAKPPAFKGTITYTLVRVDGSGDSRVAVLDQKMDATADGPLPAPPGQAGSPNLTMHMTGTGQVQMDLTRGVARVGELQTAMDGTIKRPAGAPGQPGAPGDVHLSGTTKMKMSTDPTQADGR